MPVIDIKEFSQNSEGAMQATFVETEFATEQGVNPLYQSKALTEQLAYPKSVEFELNRKSF